MNKVLSCRYILILILFFNISMTLHGMSSGETIESLTSKIQDLNATAEKQRGQAQIEAYEAVEALEKQLRELERTTATMSKEQEKQIATASAVLQAAGISADAVNPAELIKEKLAASAARADERARKLEDDAAAVENDGEKDELKRKATAYKISASISRKLNNNPSKNLEFDEQQYFDAYKAHPNALTFDHDDFIDSIAAFIQTQLGAEAMAAAAEKAAEEAERQRIAKLDAAKKKIPKFVTDFWDYWQNDDPLSSSTPEQLFNGMESFLQHNIHFSAEESGELQPLIEAHLATLKKSVSEAYNAAKPLDLNTVSRLIHIFLAAILEPFTNSRSILGAKNFLRTETLKSILGTNVFTPGVEASFKDPIDINVEYFKTSDTIMTWMFAALCSAALLNEITKKDDFNLLETTLNQSKALINRLFELTKKAFTVCDEKEANHDFIIVHQKDPSLLSTFEARNFHDELVKLKPKKELDLLKKDSNQCPIINSEFLQNIVNEALDAYSRRVGPLATGVALENNETLKLFVAFTSLLMVSALKIQEPGIINNSKLKRNRPRTREEIEEFYKAYFRPILTDMAQRLQANPDLDNIKLIIQEKILMLVMLVAQPLNPPMTEVQWTALRSLLFWLSTYDPKNPDATDTFGSCCEQLSLDNTSYTAATDYRACQAVLRAAFENSVKECKFDVNEASEIILAEIAQGKNPLESNRYKKYEKTLLDGMEKEQLKVLSLQFAQGDFDNIIAQLHGPIRNHVNKLKEAADRAERERARREAEQQAFFATVQRFLGHQSGPSNESAFLATMLTAVASGPISPDVAAMQFETMRPLFFNGIPSTISGFDRFNAPKIQTMPSQLIYALDTFIPLNFLGHTNNVLNELVNNPKQSMTDLQSFIHENLTANDNARSKLLSYLESYDFIGIIKVLSAYFAHNFPTFFFLPSDRYLFFEKNMTVEDVIRSRLARMNTLIGEL